MSSRQLPARSFAGVCHHGSQPAQPAIRSRDEASRDEHARLRTAQHCRQIYGAKFIGGQDVMDVATIYRGPDPKAYVPDGG
jgi:hypothetical protein